MALGAYRRLIDPSCESDEEAEEAILEAVRYAHGPPSTRTDGVRRLRAPKRTEVPWSRCYFVVGPTGDVIDVQPASGAARSVREQEPRGPGRPPLPVEDRRVMIALRVPRETAMGLSALAERWGISQSDVVTRLVRAVDEVVRLSADLTAMTQRAETAEANSTRLQQHRDAWRAYAYGKRERPSDFLDNAPSSDTGPTEQERLKRERDEALVALRRLKQAVEGQLAKGYVLSYEPGAAATWRVGWNKVLADVERALDAVEKKP